MSGCWPARVGAEALETSTWGLGPSVWLQWWSLSAGVGTVVGPWEGWERGRGTWPGDGGPSSAKGGARRLALRACRGPFFRRRALGFLGWPGRPLRARCLPSSMDAVARRGSRQASPFWPDKAACGSRQGPPSLAVAREHATSVNVACGPPGDSLRRRTLSWAFSPKGTPTRPLAVCVLPASMHSAHARTAAPIGTRGASQSEPPHMACWRLPA